MPRILYCAVISIVSLMMKSAQFPVRAFATHTPSSRRRPSVPSVAAAAANDDDASNSREESIHCAVVGVGVLGTSLCRQILQHPDMTHWTVTGVTRTTTHHDAIRQAMPAEQVHRLRLTTREDLKFTPSSDGDKDDDSGATRFSNVVFCAPPSGSTDYPADVKDAIDNLWTGPDSNGVFCFTSSSGVYPEESGTVTETTPITDTTPRTERLLQAEKFCLEAGGCALRLAGLYLLERGAHSFYMKSTPEKPIQGNPSGLVNLLHYDDAAGACLAALLAGPGVCRNQIFLICDGALQTRQQICESTLQSAAYRDCTMPTFASEPDPANPGKQLDGTFSNQALQWSPRYKSFDEFMKDNA